MQEEEQVGSGIYSNSFYKCIWFIIFAFSLFVPLKMASARAESTLEKYGALLNLFQSEIKIIIRKLERINYKIDNDTHTHTHRHIHIYIYI